MAWDMDAVDTTQKLGDWNCWGDREEMGKPRKTVEQLAGRATDQGGGFWERWHQGR